MCLCQGSESAALHSRIFAAEPVLISAGGWIYGFLCLMKAGDSALLRNRPFEVILLLNVP